MLQKEIKIGSILTLNCELITETGKILFSKGDKVEVEKILIKEGRWSRLCPDIYYPEEITGIVLVNHPLTEWTLSIFEETAIKNK